MRSCKDICLEIARKSRKPLKCVTLQNNRVLMTGKQAAFLFRFDFHLKEKAIYFSTKLLKIDILQVSGFELETL